MKTRFKKVLLQLPGFQAVCRLLTRRHLRVLMYHRFTRQPRGDGRRLPAPVFEAQIERIVRHHTVWTPDRMLAMVRGGGWPGGSCPVVLTVDDGYQDFFQVAFPILRRNGLPALLFLITGFLDGSTWPWWDRLRFVLDNSARRGLSLAVGGETLDLDLGSAAGRARAWDAISDRCRFLPEPERKGVMADLERALRVEVPEVEETSYRPVTWDQVREMSAAGIRMGAHTVSHPILSRVDSRRAWAEIDGSRARLADEFSSPVDWFCYPQGGPPDFTPEVRDLVEAAGFRGCFVAFPDPVDPDDPFTLPRYPVGADPVDFQWKLCGAEYLWRRLRRNPRPTGPLPGQGA